MLVLTRKMNERIIIGENIRITVVGIRGNHVRLGLEAPPEITILRDELCRHPAAADIPTPPDGLREPLTTAPGSNR
jgi:carbon storage regulator